MVVVAFAAKGIRFQESLLGFLLFLWEGTCFEEGKVAYSFGFPQKPQRV